MDRGTHVSAVKLLRGGRPVKAMEYMSIALKHTHTHRAQVLSHTQPPHLCGRPSPGGRLGMGTPQGSKKYNLEISANPSSIYVGSYNGVLVVLW